MQENYTKVRYELTKTAEKELERSREDELLRSNENQQPKIAKTDLEQKRLQLFMKAQEDLKHLKKQMFNVRAVYLRKKSNSNSNSITSSQSSC